MAINQRVYILDKRIYIDVWYGFQIWESIIILLLCGLYSIDRYLFDFLHSNEGQGFIRVRTKV